MPDNEAPSKTVLLERRDERALVREGKSVLEERRDILAQAIMVELRAATELHEKLTEQMNDALLELRHAALRHGPGGLRRFAVERATIPEPVWPQGNYFGTRMLGEPDVDAAPSAEQRWHASEELARARLSFHNLLLRIIDTAARMNNLTRLTREFRRTQRKVNALEHVVMPELEQSIRTIEFALEEMERENMVRALGVKRQMNAP